MRKKLLFLLLPFLLLLLGACGNRAAEYTITVSGTAQSAGVLSFLDYSLNVYPDQASNPCGDCPDQPVHLYVGDDAAAAAQAIADQIDRAEDRWEVVSVQDGTVVLRVREGEQVTDAGSLSAPEGLTLEGTFTQNGTSVTLRSSTYTDSAEVSSAAAVSAPQRIAAVYGPSYEALVVLGAEDRIVVRADVQTDSFPWAEVVFSRIDSLPVLENVHTAVNFEQLMNYTPDLVLTFPRQNELTQLAQAGIAAIPGATYSDLNGVCELLSTYAEAIGGDAPARAQEYCSYFHQKLQAVADIVDTIPQSERITVYYAGADLLSTYGSRSDVTAAIEAAGGIAVSAELNAGNRSQINYEQLAAWNPQVIFLDHGGMNSGESVEQLKQDLMSGAQYASLSAVQTGSVYTVPSGVFYWDMGLQKILLVEYMAKTLYPGYFTDLDMADELTDFYSRFFGYDLTLEQAQKILNREAP